jgi:hypothetical protein
VKAGSWSAKHLDPMEDFLRSVKPMPAVFDKEYVKRLDGPNVKTGVQQVRAGGAAAGGHPTLQGGQRLRSGW